MNMQTLTVLVKVRVRAYGRTYKTLIYKNINAEFVVVFSSKKRSGQRKYYRTHGFLKSAPFFKKAM